MVFNQFVKLFRNLSFLLGFALVVSACNKEQLEVESEALKQIESHKTLADYPDEITLDNWEGFVYAPQSVIDHFVQKEKEQREFIIHRPTDDFPFSSNRSSSISGVVQAYNGFAWTPIGYVDLSICGNTSISAPFLFWPGGPNYFINSTCPGLGQLCMDYPTAVTNGVNVLDLVAIQRHILQLQCFTEAYQFLGADANRDGRISAADLLVIRKIILGIYNSFPDSDNVIFVIEDDYTNLQNLIANCSVDAFLLEQSAIIGPCLAPFYNDRRAIKTGDVDGTFSF